MSGKILLINTNRMRPRIAPIGLDYLASALERANADVRFFDLALEGRGWTERLKSLLRDFSPDLIGITVRNIDDCYFLSGRFLVSPLRWLIRHIRKYSDAGIVLGGVGYSIAPLGLLAYIEADYGIFGDGESAAVKLLQAVSSGREPKAHEIRGLVIRGQNHFQRAEIDPGRVKLNRKLADNSLYFELGGQVGIETKRGCSGKCIYCADPLAKGSKTRMREPEAVADEIEELLSSGVWAFHLCDSEFNRPYRHAAAVLSEIERRGLGKKIHLYGYFSPMPFDDDLAGLYAKAGGKGICFGADSGVDEMLSTLKRDHSAKDLETALAASRKAGIKVMYDLLLGGPGESKKTLSETISLMKRLKPDRVGISYGIRVYAGTELERRMRSEGESLRLSAGQRGQKQNPELIFPRFYVSPGLRKKGFDFLRKLVGDDNRFFLPAATAKKQNYNYSGNLYLEKLIAKGARGAYWKMLLDAGQKD